MARRECASSSLTWTRRYSTSIVGESVVGAQLIGENAEEGRHEDFDADGYRSHRLDEWKLASDLEAVIDVAGCFRQRPGIVDLLIGGAKAARQFLTSE